MTDQLFKYTIAITKAEERDGGLYVYGRATGLGLDSQGHEMTPEAIEGFQKQIRARAESGDPVPAVDWHQKDGIAVQLGDVTDARVDADWNLDIEVRLDEDNPNAQYLYKKVKKGKQFGLSVAGKVQQFARRFDEATKQAVLRFFDVALTEVSFTTKPIWTPSFGTVLAKSVFDAADAESVTYGEGDSPEMSEKDTAGLTPEATAEAPADETTPEAPAEGSATPEVVTEDAPVVEKAGARYSKATRSKFLAMYEEMGKMLREEGILDEAEPEAVEKSEPAGDAPAADAPAATDATDDNESDSAEPEVTPDADAPAAPATAEKGLETRVAELERLLAEMTARAEAAETKSKTPPMVVKPENAPDEASAELERLNKLPPADRLREAFRLARAGQ